jgi:hypothetical protein
MGSKTSWFLQTNQRTEKLDQPISSLSLGLGLRAEVWSRDLQNRKPECCHTAVTFCLHIIYRMQVQCLFPSLLALTQCSKVLGRLACGCCWVIFNDTARIDGVSMTDMTMIVHLVFGVTWKEPVYVCSGYYSDVSLMAGITVRSAGHISRFEPRVMNGTHCTAEYCYGEIDACKTHKIIFPFCGWINCISLSVYFTGLESTVFYCCLYFCCINLWIFVCTFTLIRIVIFLFLLIYLFIALYQKRTIRRLNCWHKTFLL